MRPLALASLVALGCASRTPLPATPPWPAADASAADVTAVTDASDVPAPEDVPIAAVPLRSVTRLALGSASSCALRDDGTVWCWRGGDETWQPEGVINVDAPTPGPGARAVPDASEVVDACVDFSALCALRRDGSVRCRTALHAEPMEGQEFDARVVEATLPGGPFAGFVAGNGCVLRRRDGSIVDVSPPSLPDNPFVVRPPAPQTAPRCALAEGVARCFGDNSRGLLANTAAPSIPAAAPIALFGLRDVRSVAIGERHGCVALGDGTVRCWGRNLEGQLGTGDRRSRALPTPVAGLDGVVAVGVGTFYSCALREAGDVRCWGLNREGQLGDGTAADRVAPVAVVDLPPAAELAVFQRSACARTREGAVWCWGPDGGYVGRESATRPTEVMVAAR